MHEWEYKVITSSLTIFDLVKKMNEFEEEGWELVTCFPFVVTDSNYAALFRRPRRPEAE
jgi:hypothetical protein